MSDTHTLVTRILPFQEECVFLKLQQCRSQTDVNISERIIENVLSSFGLKKIDVLMNGDCLFSCVLIHLNMVFEQNHDICLIEQLHSMGVNKTNVGISVIRDLMVDEWIMNSQEYRPFLKDDLEFETEADKYRTNGVYSTDLGDVMLLGLNNALHLQLIVFTSVPNCPYLTVSPRCPVVSREPLCLAYIQAGSGHYNLAVRSLDDGSCSSDTEMQSTDEPKKLQMQDADVVVGGMLMTVVELIVQIPIITPAGALV